MIRRRLIRRRVRDHAGTAAFDLLGENSTFAEALVTFRLLHLPSNEISSQKDAAPGASSTTPTASMPRPRKPNVWRMSLSGEQFGAVEPKRLHADQYFTLLRCGDWEAFNLEDLRATGFGNYCGFHHGHLRLLVPGLGARWVGSGEAVARDLPGAVDLLEDEEFLVGLRAASPGRIDSGEARRIGARKGPVGHNLFGFWRSRT